MEGTETAEVSRMDDGVVLFDLLPPEVRVVDRVDVVKQITDPGEHRPNIIILTARRVDDVPERAKKVNVKN